MEVEYPARAIPILPSQDIATTKTFYVDQLGFDALRYDHDGYLIVGRGKIEIHFWFTEDRNLPEVSSCYIRGGEIGALYQEYSKRGVVRLSEFAVRPSGMKEFYVHDPHGNLLRFGCPVEAA